MKILSFSTLFPNAAMPSHGIFVENRLSLLATSGHASVDVIAPVPWFPLSSSRFGRYADYARAPRSEVRRGLKVTHPRYPVIPKIGQNVAPHLLYQAGWRAVGRWIAQNGRPDLLDVHYFYPDGVAGHWIARKFDLPFVVTARGTDINLIPQKHPTPRRLIVEAATAADGIITVCEALRDAVIALGVAPDKVVTLRNGVDLVHFQPVDRAAARRRLGLTRPTLLSVGHLIERKGHHLVVEAMTELPGVDLLIAGDGEMRGALEALIDRLGLGDRVRLLGRRAQAELPQIYAAADALVLASSREGWANVLLEAMACGTPVAATAIWGTPEVVRAAEAGRLIPDRTSAAIADTARALLAELPDRAATRRYAEGFSWDATTDGQLALFDRIVTSRRGARKSAA